MHDSEVIRELASSRLFTLMQRIAELHVAVQKYEDQGFAIDLHGDFSIEAEISRAEHRKEIKITSNVRIVCDFSRITL